ncbi:hypothetical protein HDU90_002336 [Geranomyces variabilis]|nr:hypothetical protein HDU90_002336 [Geranomyces variabilis]
MGMFLFLDATFSRLATRPGVLAGAQEPGPFPETALPGIREWLAETVHFARRPVYGWFLACGVIKHGIRVQWTKGAKFSVVTSVLGENDSWPFVGWVLIDSDNSAVYANSILKSYKLSKRCLWADAEAGSPKWDRFYFFCIILALVLAMGHGKVAVDNFYWNMTPKVYQTLPAFWNFMHREFERGMPSIGGCRGCGSKSTRRCDHCRQTSYCLTCFAAIAAKEFGRSRDRALVSWGGNYVECVPCQLRRPHNSQLMHLPDIPFSLITKWLSGEDKVRLSQVHPVLRKRDVSPDAKFVREGNFAVLRLYGTQSKNVDAINAGYRGSIELPGDGASECVRSCKLQDWSVVV